MRIEVKGRNLQVTDELRECVERRFEKVGKVRFVSHRDIARAFERAFRIEQLPLAFTQGFSPRPKVSFGLALGVGHESRAEYRDLELAGSIDVDSLPSALSAALPEGLRVNGAGALAERAPSLQEAVSAVELDLVLKMVVRKRNQLQSSGPQARLRHRRQPPISADRCRGAAPTGSVPTDGPA